MDLRSDLLRRGRGYGPSEHRGLWNRAFIQEAPSNNSRSRGGNYRSRGGNYRGGRGNPRGRGGHGKPFQNCPTAVFLPGSDVRPEEVFTYPYIMDDETTEYIAKNKKIMFIIRGLSGTGKTTLSAMLIETYPTGVICSADSYFDNTFGDKFRNKETLKESHDFCQMRVKRECEKGTHPIVVQNTHVRKWEMEPYLKIAEEYGYNIIMAITMRKFKVSAEILSRSNKKGLTEEYFNIRLNQWEEFVPLYTGWFFGQDDASFILNRVKSCLELLLGDSKFCNVMNAYSENEIWGRYEVDSPLFCIASFTNHGRNKKQIDYYLSEIVQENYGKSFKLKIVGMVVTRSEVLLVVSQSEEMKKVIRHFDEQKLAVGSLSALRGDDYDDLWGAMSNLSVLEVENPRAHISFKETFPSDGSTQELEDWDDDELIEINCVTFIRVAQREGQKLAIRSVNKLATQLFSSVTNSAGCIENTSYHEFNDDTKYCRLPNSIWFVRLPEKMYIKSFFSGYYF